MEISKQQYEYALNRIEELLPLVTDETPANDRNALELTIVSDVVEEYEKLHYPISKPTIGDLICLSIEEKGMTQKQLASEIGVSPSRVSDYISGRRPNHRGVATCDMHSSWHSPCCHAWNVRVTRR